LNPGRVFITEYPIGIFKEIAEGAEPCGVLGSTVPNPGTLEGLDLDGSDAIDLGNLGILLNAMLREKARSFGWAYVDGIEHAFDGHGYCSNRPYFVSAEESCLNQGDFEGMLHPNASGHKATGECIAQALLRGLVDRAWLGPAMHMTMA
jgi:hypothetical protein